MKPTCLCRATVSGPQGLAAAPLLRHRTSIKHMGCSSASSCLSSVPSCSSSNNSCCQAGLLYHSNRANVVAAAAQGHLFASSMGNVSSGVSTSNFQQQQHASSSSINSSSGNSMQAPVQHQQHQQAVPTATAAAAQRSWQPFAALSRVLLTSSNANMFRSALTNRRQPVSGPLGVLLFLATLIAASFAAIRSVLVKKGKSCKSCRGFGLQRCRLCLGSGRVDWAAKLKHFDVCPLCMNRRFIICAECGGHYHRPMFAHRRRQAGGTFEPNGGASTGDYGDAGSFNGPIVLNLAAAGAAAGGVTVVAPSMGRQPGGVSQVLSSMSD